MFRTALGTVVGDRNEWSPATTAGWHALGVKLLIYSN